MAENIQGALPTAPAIPTVTENPQEAALRQATSDALASLNNRSGTNWFNVAGELLKPGRTGNWSEGFGNAAGELGRQIEETKRQEIPLAQAKIGLLSQQYALDKAVKLQQAQNAFIKDPTDKQAIAAIANYDPKGMAGVVDLAKNAPRIRSLLGGTANTEGTPFDVLALDNDPKIAGQARQLQTQYRNGLIDDEKGNSLAQQMLSLSINNDTRKELHGMMAGVNAELIRARTDKINQEMSAYLSPQQKMDYQKIVQPAINEAGKANTALNQLDSMEETIKNAPSGTVAGLAAKYPGAVIGSKANTALRELDAQTKSLMTLVPRLPGSQSNFDAKNLIASIGGLSDPMLTNTQRTELLGKVREGFEKLASRGYQIQNTWEETKKVDPVLTDRKAATVGPNAPKSEATFEKVPAAQIPTLRAQAADAIAQGADPVKVKASFKSMTGMNY